uniref:Uncharacterized protein n=1 Tax=Phenylobacterium glaciei TaxID=2803784 RepID=A0A974P2U8_9CAUL|nr:hypothetical protein JKL49_27425 [Phenylobacterium glaciei]
MVSFEDVQLSDLVEASPFADRMDLTAKASGTIPSRSRRTGCGSRLANCTPRDRAASPSVATP